MRAVYEHRVVVLSGLGIGKPEEFGPAWSGALGGEGEHGWHVVGLMPVFAEQGPWGGVLVVLERDISGVMAERGAGRGAAKAGVDPRGPAAVPWPGPEGWPAPEFDWNDARLPEDPAALERVLAGLRGPAASPDAMRRFRDALGADWRADAGGDGGTYVRNAGAPPRPLYRPDGKGGFVEVRPGDGFAEAVRDLHGGEPASEPAAPEPAAVVPPPAVRGWMFRHKGTGENYVVRSDSQEHAVTGFREWLGRTRASGLEDWSWEEVALAPEPGAPVGPPPEPEAGV
jgi:hypothetical protein